MPGSYIDGRNGSHGKTDHLDPLIIWGLLCGIPQFSTAGDRNRSVSTSGFAGSSFTEQVGGDIRCGPVCSAPNPPDRGLARGVQRTDAHSWGATVMAWYLRKNYDWRPQVKIEMDSTRLITCELPHTQGASATTYSAGSDRHIDLKWPSGFQHERQCRQPALSLPDLGLRISPRRLLVALRRR